MGSRESIEMGKECEAAGASAKLARKEDAGTPFLTNDSHPGPLDLRNSEQ